MRGLTSTLVTRMLVRLGPGSQVGHGVRGCHSSMKITGSAMDANTVFHLDKYSRFVNINTEHCDCQVCAIFIFG